MNFALQIKTANADPRVGRYRVLWVWGFIHLGASSGIAVLGVSAWMVCKMVKFLFQHFFVQHAKMLIYNIFYPITSSLGRQFSNALIIHTPLPVDIHQAILFSLWLILLFYSLNLPFYSHVFWTWSDTAGLNQSMFSPAHHLLPQPVMNPQRSQEQDKIIAVISLLPSHSFRSSLTSASSALCSHSLQKWPHCKSSSLFANSFPLCQDQISNWTA